MARSKDQRKSEITQVACDGINQYLQTMRGAQFFRKAQATVVPGTYTVQVSYHVEGDNRVHFLELTVKGGL